ncbi:MAG: hypothetical protein K2M64_04155 [Clostridia bacterium]|nr:hypothetical protein [Clostridia bacterium]
MGKRYITNSWYYTKEQIVMPSKLDFQVEGFDGYIFNELLRDALIYELKRNGGFYIDSDIDGMPQGWISTESAYIVSVQFDTNIPSLMSAQFRIYYTPLGESVKLNVPKTNPQENQFCIPYSQQQPIVDNITLGREMQSVANRAGCKMAQVVRTLPSITKRRKPGTVVYEKDANGKRTGNVWRLTGNQIEIHNKSKVKVMETWSKNWSYRSENVPINREFRSWNIPADIVQRNMLWQDYCLITQKDVNWGDNTCLLTDDAREELMRGLDGSSSGKITECNNMWFYTRGVGRVSGAVLSCSSFGFGNSLVFSGKTKDNLSAGIQRVNSDDDDKNSQFCKDVYYCNDDGKLDEMYIQLGGAIYTGSAESVYSYPECYNNGKGTVNMFDEIDGVALFNEEKFKIQKDPCEQLNFTYQLHLLTDDGQLVIGSTWAATNPLVQQRDGNKTIKVWKLTQPLPQGAQVMTKEYGEYYGSMVEQKTWNLFYVNGTQILFNQGKSSDGQSVNDGQGVCVTDEHNNILIAYNSPDPATFYVNFTHDYNAIAQAVKKDEGNYPVDNNEYPVQIKYEDVDLSLRATAPLVIEEQLDASLDSGTLTYLITESDSRLNEPLAKYTVEMDGEKFEFVGIDSKALKTGSYTYVEKTVTQESTVTSSLKPGIPIRFSHSVSGEIDINETDVTIIDVSGICELAGSADTNPTAEYVDGKIKWGASWEGPVNISGSSYTVTIKYRGRYRNGGIYKHQVSLIEPSKLLQGVTIDGFGVSQPEEYKKRQSLEDVLLRLFQVAILDAPKRFSLTQDSTVRRVLSTVKSPEFKWNTQTTLWECLVQIGAVIDAMPRLVSDDKGNFTVVTFDFINACDTIVDNLDDELTNALGLNVEESQYNTALSAIVENLRENE